MLFTAETPTNDEVDEGHDDNAPGLPLSDEDVINLPTALLCKADLHRRKLLLHRKRQKQYLKKLADKIGVE